MLDRLRKLIIKTGGLIGAGLFYAFICKSAGRPLIPCLFHTVTGLYCPGCGVSRMCLSLLRLDFHGAFRSNAAILLMLPAGLAIAFKMAVRYIKDGRAQPTFGERLVLYGMTGILLVFGILRNLPAFSWMRPV